MTILLSAIQVLIVKLHFTAVIYSVHRRVENGAVYFVKDDMTYKSYDVLKPELDKAKKEEIDDALIEGEAKGIDKGKQERNIEIVKTMLKNNVDIDIIISSTGLTKKEIIAIGTQSEN